jgi:hypothetical protein
MNGYRRHVPCDLGLLRPDGAEVAQGDARHRPSPGARLPLAVERRSSVTHRSVLSYSRYTAVHVVPHCGLVYRNMEAIY